ncbi:MAG: amidase domain-containing protein [Planctomycetia bacterium]|nr:amidase domain-containing protein [Planctomycetia bacterium]
MKPYNRSSALAYAEKWAFKRNPAYYDFSEIGGDCTNFISQCLYEGCKVMNYAQPTGWFYNSVYSRSASWTGVSFFYQFLINNKGAGPFASEISSFLQLLPGDIIQLGSEGKGWHHSLLVLNVGDSYESLTVATHSKDSYDRSLSTYSFNHLHFLHIEGIRS